MLEISVYIIIYIVSYLGCWLFLRFLSERHLDVILNTDSVFSWTWIAPFVNSIYAIVLLLFVIAKLFEKVPKIKSKFFNTDF